MVVATLVFPLVHYPDGQHPCSSSVSLRLPPLCSRFQIRRPASASACGKFQSSDLSPRTEPFHLSSPLDCQVTSPPPAISLSARERPSLTHATSTSGAKAMALLLNLLELGRDPLAFLER